MGHQMSSFSIEKQFSTFGQQNYYYSKPQVKECKKQHKCPLVPTKVRVAAVGGTAAGVLGALFCTVKCHSKLIEKDAKFIPTGKIFSDMFKIPHNPKTLMVLGVGTVLGGLVGGILADKKKHYAAKMKEGFHQLVGIILLPLVLAEGGLKILEHYGFREGLAPIEGKGKFINGVRRGLPAALVSLAAIVGGMQIGNAFCNKVDEYLFEDVDVRKIKAKDYLAHTDEIFETAAFIDTAGKWKGWLGKILPVTYGTCGYWTGIARKEREASQVENGKLKMGN